MTKDIILYYIITMSACLLTILSMEYLHFFLALLALPTILALFFYAMFEVRMRYGPAELKEVIVYVKMCASTVIVAIIILMVYSL